MNSAGLMKKHADLMERHGKGVKRKKDLLAQIAALRGVRGKGLLEDLNIDSVGAEIKIAKEKLETIQDELEQIVYKIREIASQVPSAWQHEQAEEDLTRKSKIQRTAEKIAPDFARVESNISEMADLAISLCYDSQCGLLDGTKVNDCLSSLPAKARSLFLDAVNSRHSGILQGTIAPPPRRTPPVLPPLPVEKTTEQEIADLEGILAEASKRVPWLIQTISDYRNQFEHTREPGARAEYEKEYRRHEQNLADTRAEILATEAKIKAITIAKTE